MTSHVTRDHREGILRLTIDRPDKKNALTAAMYADLADGLKAAENDPMIRVVLVTGSAGVFTAGNDIADFMAIATNGDGAARHVADFLSVLSTFAKPIVAAVPGLAVGIGTTMLLHCDYVLLAASASLSVPFVSLGLVPEAGSSLLLPGHIGHQRAFAMFALGEALDAQKAVAWGLANRVVPDDQLEAAAWTIATALAGRSPGALCATKRLMRDEDALAARMAAELESFRACLRSPEALAAFQAFADRRKG